MTGINGAKFKLMPNSPEADLDIIQNAAKRIVEDFNGNNKKYEIIPIAFGLNSITVFFYYPDNQEIEEIEKKLSHIENVSSVELIDMRKIA